MPFVVQALCPLKDVQLLYVRRAEERCFLSLQEQLVPLLHSAEQHAFVNLSNWDGKEILMKCEECQQELWKAGEIVPAGAYARVDDGSYHIVLLEQAGPLPATFDGHTALSCSSACWCDTSARQSVGKRAER